MRKAREVAGYYYGSQLYVHLTKKRHKMKTCENVVVQVTSKTFLKWANDLKEKMMNN